MQWSILILLSALLMPAAEEKLTVRADAELVFTRLMAAATEMSSRLRAQGLPEFGPAPAFALVPEVSGNRLIAVASGSLVFVTPAFVELLNDDELAFLLGHELGHVYQWRLGCMGRNPCIGAVQLVTILAPPNAEDDADAWGFLLGTLAGYDPYAAGSFVGKSALASGTADFIRLGCLAAYPRLMTLFEFVQRACGETGSLPARLLGLDCAARRKSERPSLTWLPL